MSYDSSNIRNNNSDDDDNDDGVRLGDEFLITVVQEPGKRKGSNSL